MDIVIAIIVGLLIGSAVTAAILRAKWMPKTSGTLRPAYDEDEVYLFVDLDETPAAILKHEYAIFKVDPNDISHN